MFLRNGWYAAIWSNDLQARPVGRTFLNEKVVLFRNGRGQAAALEDCCCHRAAPLSRGEVSGDYLACGYHGLKYDISGQCVEVPGQTMIPRGAKVRSYPVCEKWGAVWIWMGEPAKVDESKIPNLYWLADPAWTATPGYIHLKSNYQFLIDNLLDLTHVIYVHKKTLAGDPREATTPTKTERLPDGVRIGRWLIDFVPPPLYAKAGNFTGNVDRWQFATWIPVLLCPQLCGRRRRRVQAALRGLESHVSGRRGHARSRAGQPLRGLARRPRRYRRGRRAIAGAAHAGANDRGRIGVSCARDTRYRRGKPLTD